jgi:hypothetical protein
MRAHPRFPAALRTLGTGMLALYRGNRLLDMLINDRGRMQIGYLALYLHEGGVPDGRGRGFGVGQMKALCAAAGFASPGRSAAMLALMRMSGYIASASAPEDRQRHIMVPTERLRTAHRDRWVSVVASLREIHPKAAAAFALGDPEFVAAYVRLTADHREPFRRVAGACPHPAARCRGAGTDRALRAGRVGAAEAAFCRRGRQLLRQFAALCRPLRAAGTR